MDQSLTICQYLKMTVIMAIRERALAAIQHQPVDCIPFVDINVDFEVAKAIAGGEDKLITNPKSILVATR